MINIKNTSIRFRAYCKSWAFIALLIFSLTAPKYAHACCTSCAQSDCNAAVNFISQAHDDLRQNTKDRFDGDLEAFQNWLIEIFLQGEVVPAMAAMATQMAAVSMEYTQIVGSFLDAQLQLDTQRVLRKLQFEAHKDYQPSETFCYFGTNVRSLAATENKGRFNALALSQISLARQMGTLGQAGSSSVNNDYKTRWEQFVDHYCDPLENNFQDQNPMPSVSRPLTGLSSSDTRTGLILACDWDSSESGSDIGARDRNRFNRDINYTRLMDKPRTLFVDFTDATQSVSVSPISSLYVGPIKQPRDEEDVMAMSRYLYGNRVLTRALSGKGFERGNAKKLYLALRSVAAKRNVAQASFNAIVALKSSGTSDELPLVGFPKPTVTNTGTLSTVTPVMLEQQTRRYLAAIMAQLLPADPVSTAGNIFDLIGYSPSYYSQLEILAKRIYQNPDFYAQLYDSPANVGRKKVAMKAIELMVDRTIYESQIRREMSISVLLSSKLRSLHRTAGRDVSVGVGNK